MKINYVLKIGYFRKQEREMSNWLIDKLIPSINWKNNNKSSIPEGLWIKCSYCESITYKPTLEKNLNVCKNCNFHMKISARNRLNAFLDEENKSEIAQNLSPNNSLNFKDLKKYKDRIASAQKITEEKDALIAIEGSINGLSIVTAAFEFNFIGGSMGSVVGEKFVQAAKISLEKNIPFICFSASGGARMQEAIISLMQMAKTSAILALLKEKGIPFISVLTNPVYGGVSASLAMLGDIIISEPYAKIGFAGPRVIEQTAKEKLPEGFQTAEFLLENGSIDLITSRYNLKNKIYKLLKQITYFNKKK